MGKKSMVKFFLDTCSVVLACSLMWAGTALACTGDCDGNAAVTVDEILRGVNIALGSRDVSDCPVFDQSGDAEVTVDEILHAVRAALEGCPVPTITTIVGTGVAGLNEDGLSGPETLLYLPQDISVGPDADLYFTDWNNHRIRRLRNGIVDTVAGTGELGDAVDGPAEEIQFNHPTSVAFDAEGRMIIAAWHNSKVKRLDLSTGLVRNLAGTGARAFGGDGGPGNEALLDLPSSVAVDANGNIVISDQANFRLRLLEPNGTIYTVCGTGVPGFSGDNGPALDAQLNAPKGQSAPPAARVAVDGRNRIVIADTANHRIRRIEGDGTIHTIAGAGEAGYSGDDGPAVEARLNTPSDVAVAPNGSIYVADTMNHVVRVIRTDGTIGTLAGTGNRGYSGDGGPAASAELDRPYGVDVAPNGTVYVCDTHNHRIRRITGTGANVVPTPKPLPTPEVIPCTDEVGSICTYAGTGETGFNGDGEDRLHTVLYWPWDIEFAPSGRRIVLDWNNHRVREILPDDTFATIVGTDFVGDGPADLSDLTPEGAAPLTVDLNHPTDVVEFPDGDLLLVAWHNHKLRSVDAVSGRVRVLLGADAGFAGDGGPARQARASQPPHGTFDAAGNFFFVDQRNQRIRVVRGFADARGEAVVDTVVGTGTAGFNGDGDARETEVNFPAGGNPEPSGGITIDTEGRLYFADSNNHRIRRVQFSRDDFTDGVVTTLAGTGVPGYGGDGGPATEAQIDFPQDLEIGPDGNLYFADTNNHRVRVVDLSSGTIDTIAGTGERGYAGDGGPALTAQLNRPFGVAFDADGDLYIADSFNSRIRKVKR
jgi:sugar lactone lactonase YvrE